jgi:hypothetical protein
LPASVHTDAPVRQLVTCFWHDWGCEQSAPVLQTLHVPLKHTLVGPASSPASSSVLHPVPLVTVPVIWQMGPPSPPPPPSTHWSCALTHGPRSQFPPDWHGGGGGASITVGSSGGPASASATPPSGPSAGTASGVTSMVASSSDAI